ncbi:DUF6634 family protein [Devosia sp. CAU 1758]
MKRVSAKTLKRALRDWERLASGHSPSPEDLSNAPLLTDWEPRWTASGVMYLVGEVQGHPKLADGPCSTSLVLAADVREGWARTISRYYRLGPQRGETLH